ncbi:MAG: AraC family transcriptional regulator [Firmicutes bacterium]|nr:AraC family transcriptional regulator [Bacillota bacterium]
MGDDRYQPCTTFLPTAELPIVSQVTEASPDRSYLTLGVKLEPARVGSVMVLACQAFGVAITAHDENRWGSPDYI